ncbi:MAG: segregation/condensation protein A [Deltaproteobacteria bacterium]|nr:segregation/condensation protein A [Deltaproteobacteria bacterium]
MTENYEVKLEIFEGPLDLLIHLIHKNEVDIFDIPIATITDQYLEYLDIMKALNIDVAGDFLVMASTLVHIKSKMLLPAKEDDEEDPRIELTRPLLEYMRFKEIAGELSDREILDRDVFARHLSPEFLGRIKDEDPQLDVNLFQLMDAFKRIMEQRLPGAQLKLKLAQWSVKEKTEVIIALLKKRGAVFFNEVFDADRTVSELIVTFLALLELVHIGLIKIFQPTAESEIRLIPSFDENGETNNGYRDKTAQIDH